MVFGEYKYYFEIVKSCIKIERLLMKKMRNNKVK